MTTYPTLTNGGLIFVALAAAILIAAVYADNFCTQNNPGAIIRQDLRTGAINNNLQTQGAVMSDSTERLAAISTAAGPRKPWWACHQTVRDLDVPSEDCAAWVRWTSEPMAEAEDIEVCLERMVTLDEDLVVCDVEDCIRVECDDSTVFLPVGLADDMVELIRAASSIYGASLAPFSGPLEADGWVDETGKTWPSKAAFYAAAQRG